MIMLILFQNITQNGHKNIRKQFPLNTPSND